MKKKSSNLYGYTKVPGWFQTNKRMARTITIPDFMLHYRPIVIKQLGCSRKTDKVVSGVEDPDESPHTFGCLNSDQLKIKKKKNEKKTASSTSDGQTV